MHSQKLKSVKPAALIHPSSEVYSFNIGYNTTIWQYAVVLKGAVIGRNCNIAAHTFIEDDVVIGDNVTIKSGVYVWNGITLEDDVFVGPAVVFTNDLRPRSKDRKEQGTTIIKKGASLGANTSVLTGVTVGEYAMTGMGAVVTKDVPPHALVYGNPARIHGWVDKKGRNLLQQKDNSWRDEEGNVYDINTTKHKTVAARAKASVRKTTMVNLIPRSY
jgi:UDP-2-acetamido-3-amino-2,3-dideoxy-glucuronate N-acetyltransferase